jgi:hypothetical protein
MALMTGADAQTIKQERISHKFIKTYMAGKYPTAKCVLIVDQINGYKVFFKTEEGKYVSLFSLNNEWIKTEKKIKPAELPDSVKLAFRNSKYAQSAIILTEKVSLSDQSIPLYLLVTRYLNVGTDSDVSELSRLYFTSSGHLAKSEIMTEPVLYPRSFDER